MGYAMSNEGTKIPDAFKKKPRGRPPKDGVAKGKRMYMSQIKKGGKK